jgi:hypothetical protein
VTPHVAVVAASRASRFGLLCDGHGGCSDSTKFSGAGLEVTCSRVGRRFSLGQFSFYWYSSVSPDFVTHLTIGRPTARVAAHRVPTVNLGSVYTGDGSGTPKVSHPTHLPK